MFSRIFRTIYHVFIITFVLVIIPNISFSKVIKEIEINGNDRIPKETILMFGDLKVGSDVDTNYLNNILKNIYESNFFEDV